MNDSQATQLIDIMSEIAKSLSDIDNKLSFILKSKGINWCSMTQQLHIIQRDTNVGLQLAIEKFIKNGKFRVIGLSIIKDNDYENGVRLADIHYEAWLIIEAIQ